MLCEARWSRTERIEGFCARHQGEMTMKRKSAGDIFLGLGLAFFLCAPTGAQQQTERPREGSKQVRNENGVYGVTPTPDSGSVGEG
jgi:hypothetical protein